MNEFQQEQNKYPIVKITDYLPTVINELHDDTMGVETGIGTLDEQIRGLKPTELIIIAGRPSMGKTSFMVDAALNISKTKSVVIFSLEMCAKVLIERMLANAAKISFARLKSNKIMESEQQHLKVAEMLLLKRDIYIDESSLITPMHIYKTVKEINNKEDIGCVFVDYLQLMNLHKLVENRNQELSVITRHLKAMAKGFNIPFVVLCQLNRAVEYRGNNKPRLSDLRDSGAIEQDSDIVILLHRPSYYSMIHSSSSTDTGQAEMIVAKNRNGPTGMIQCVWDSKLMSFSDGTSMEDF